MDPKQIVKRELRAACIRGPLPAKVIATELVPAKRIYKATDDEEVKDIRVWELRDLLPNAARENPEAALELVAALLNLDAVGFVIAQAPKPEATAHDLVVEAAEAGAAVGDVQAAVIQAAADGFVSPVEAEDVDRRKRRAVRELVQVGVLAHRFEEPQLAIGGSR